MTLVSISRFQALRIEMRGYFTVRESNSWHRPGNGDSEKYMGETVDTCCSDVLSLDMFNKTHTSMAELGIRAVFRWR